MKRHIGGYIVNSINIIDIGLWQRRMKADRLCYERLKKALVASLEKINQRRKELEGK